MSLKKRLIIFTLTEMSRYIFEKDKRYSLRLKILHCQPNNKYLKIVVSIPDYKEIAINNLCGNKKESYERGIIAN